MEVLAPIYTNSKLAISRDVLRHFAKEKAYRMSKLGLCAPNLKYSLEFVSTTQHDVWTCLLLSIQ